MKNKISDIMISIYESLRYSVKDIAIFPGENLTGVLHFAIIVSLISTVAELFFDNSTLLDYRGAWAGTLILAIIHLISFKNRGEVDGEDYTDGIPSTFEEDIEASSTGSINESRH